MKKIQIVLACLFFTAPVMANEEVAREVLGGNIVANPLCTPGSNNGNPFVQNAYKRPGAYDKLCGPGVDVIECYRKNYGG